MSEDLSKKKCIPCEGNIAGFDMNEIHKYLKMVDGWEVKEDENSIFYLRARGIDYSSAQKILIKAFAKEVIDDFSLSSLQDISEIALDNWIDG